MKPHFIYAIFNMLIIPKPSKLNHPINSIFNPQNYLFIPKTVNPISKWFLLFAGGINYGFQLYKN